MKDIPICSLIVLIVMRGEILFLIVYSPGGKLLFSHLVLISLLGGDWPTGDCWECHIPWSFPVATGCDSGTSSSRAVALCIPLPGTYFFCILNPLPPILCSNVAFLVRPTRTALQNHKLIPSLSPISLPLHYFVFHTLFSNRDNWLCLLHIVCLTNWNISSLCV